MIVIKNFALIFIFLAFAITFTSCAVGSASVRHYLRTKNHRIKWETKPVISLLHETKGLCMYQVWTSGRRNGTHRYMRVPHLVFKHHRKFLDITPMSDPGLGDYEQFVQVLAIPAYDDSVFRAEVTSFKIRHKDFIIP